MRINVGNLLIISIAILLLFLPLGCSTIPKVENEVVIYVSVDQPFAEPILEKFEDQTKINVKAVYDVEAAKTTGLVNRLIAEKKHPQADVFWNSEIIQTMVLKDKDILAQYNSPEAENIKVEFKDIEGYWTGFAARARVLIINVDRVSQPNEIDSFDDLFDLKWSGQEIGIAYPLFGTTATHAAALFALYGPDKARAIFSDIVNRDIRVVDGNSVVRDLVAQGTLMFGFTDTDDACTAIRNGAHVVIKLPDQDGIGALVIPGTVALVNGAPHPKAAKTLIDYLLSVEVEQILMEKEFSHIPVHTSLASPSSCFSVQNMKPMDIDYNEVFKYFDIAQAELRNIFLK